MIGDPHPYNECIGHSGCCVCNHPEADPVHVKPHPITEWYILRVYNNMEHRLTITTHPRLIDLVSFDRRARPGCAVWSIKVEKCPNHGLTVHGYKREQAGYLCPEQLARVEDQLVKGNVHGPF